MGIREDIQTALTGNAPLMAVLTGGVHTDTLTRQTTPTAFHATTLELLPCARVKLEVETPTGPIHNAVRTPVAVYFYQRAGTGYAQIDAAKALVFDLLHRQKVGANTWEVFFADDTGDVGEDPLVGNMSMQRYYVTRRRT